MTAQRKAFAVIGDRYHNSDYIRTALRRTLVDGVGIEIDFTDDVTALTAERLADYPLLILFRDGMVWPDGYDMEPRGAVSISEPPVADFAPTRIDWMTSEQGSAIGQFVEAGGAAMLYHNVTYIATNNPEFRKVLGAATEGHPPVRPFKVQVTNSEHPITRGLGDFVVTDEQHYLVYDGAPEHVLLRSINEEGLVFGNLGTTCEAGWAYEYGQGRVCYLAPGHTIRALWNPTYVQMQQNAVRWLLREL